MVVAHHLIWTVYGWWLPNDPRGSSSKEIRVEPVAELGDLHYGRKPVPPSRAEMRDFSRRAREVLCYPVLTFDEGAFPDVAATFAAVIRERRYTCYACAVMPDHVHLLVRRHRDRAEQMIEHLQDASRADLIAKGYRYHGHPVWGGRGWKVFQFSRADVERAVRYVEGNPAERNLPAQRWDFATPYDGWLPGGAG